MDARVWGWVLGVLCSPTLALGASLLAILGLPEERDGADLAVDPRAHQRGEAPTTPARADHPRRGHLSAAHGANVYR